MSYKEKAVSRVLERVLISEADKDRKERARNDFAFFCQTYLPHIFRKPFADFQLEIISFLENPQMKRVVVAAPREHGKTSLIYLGYVLWSILYGKHKFIVCIGASEQRAKEQLEDIRLELENNTAILQDFGEVIKRATVERIDTVHTTVISRGAGQKLRGLVKRGERPDLVILDDIESEEHANSKSLRDKLKKWFYRVVMGLSQNAKIFVIGTILHYDSLLNELITKGQELGWFAKKYKAITDEDKPLHPYLWTLEALEKKKQEIGSYAFASEYMNEPLSDEDRVFRQEWIKYYEEKLDLSKLDIVAGVDPSTGKEKGDYTAIAVLGRDKETGCIYSLFIYNKRATPNELIDTLISVQLTFKPSLIVFEEVAFQEVYRKLIQDIASKRGVSLPIRGVKPHTNKVLRAQKLVPFFEGGLVYFAKGQEEAVKQLLEFPFSAHDDIVDALVYAVMALEERATAFPYKFLKLKWL